MVNLIHLAGPGAILAKASNAHMNPRRGINQRNRKGIKLEKHGNQYSSPLYVTNEHRPVCEGL